MALALYACVNIIHAGEMLKVELYTIALILLRKITKKGNVDLHNKENIEKKRRKVHAHL